MVSAGPGVAVVGTGFGCFTHVRALRAAGFDVRALVGRDPTRTAARAAAFGVPRAATDLTAVLEDPAVVAVTVATPPATHCALATAALEAGRHVLCEKPMAADAAEARRLLATAESSGLVHLLGTEFRYDAGQALLARAVADGAVGRPRLATWLLHVPVLVEAGAEVPEWWADAGAGGGWFTAHGSQWIDQVRVTVGEFAAVSASLLHVVERPMTADDGFVVHFRLTNGCVGTLQSTASDRGILVETRVTGSEGTAWIDGVGDTVRVADATGVRRLEVPGSLRGPAAPALPEGAVQTAYEVMTTFGVEYAPYVRLAGAFRALIEGGALEGPAPATFADGVAQMEVVDAVRRSAAAGGAWTEVASGL